MEFLRILVISAIAPLCGIAFFVASDTLFREADASSPLGVWVVMLAIVWVFASAISFVLGTLLHLAIARHRVGPSSVFLLFFVASAAMTALFFLLPGITHNLPMLAFGTGLSAWAMYCFGPLRLLRPRAVEA